jgi:hypothetical protein
MKSGTLCFTLNTNCYGVGGVDPTYANLLRLR